MLLLRPWIRKKKTESKNMMPLYVKERSKKPCTRTMPLKRQVLKKETMSSLSRRIFNIYSRCSATFFCFFITTLILHKRN